MTRKKSATSSPSDPTRRKGLRKKGREKKKSVFNLKPSGKGGEGGLPFSSKKEKEDRKKT